MSPVTLDSKFLKEYDSKAEQNGDWAKIFGFSHHGIPGTFRENRFCKEVEDGAAIPDVRIMQSGKAETVVNANTHVALTGLKDISNYLKIESRGRNALPILREKW